MLPAALLILLRELGVGQLALLVVGVDQVVDDSAGFPERDPGVGIFDGWHAAIGVHVGVRLLLDHAEVDELGLVGEAELFEDDGDLDCWVSRCLERGAVE